ncbi:MAG: glycosyltransferase family 4 protein [Candidatus Helarchaeota archaeon]
MRKVRVSIIGEFPLVEGGYSGGPKEVCYNLFNELKKNNCLKIKRFMPIGIRQFLKNLRYNYRNKKTERFLFYSLFILVKLIIGKFDIIHFLGYPRKLSFLILLKKFLGAKVIYTANGLTILENKMGYSHKWIYQKLEKTIINSVDLVIAVSEIVKEKIEEIYDPLQIKVIPNAINSNFYKPASNKEQIKNTFIKKYKLPKDSKIIFTAAGIRTVKGIQYMLEAFQMLNNYTKSLVFLISGYRDIYHKYIEDRYIKPIESVKYIGKIDKINLIEAYQAADIYIQTSKYEAFGIAPLEAMACGCPVIVSERVGMSYLIEEGINGFVVQYRNKEDLAKKIKLLMADDDLREKIGTKARKTAEQISWEMIAKKYTDTYKRVMND